MAINCCGLGGPRQRSSSSALGWSTIGRSTRRRCPAGCVVVSRSASSEHSPRRCCACVRPAWDRWAARPSWRATIPSPRCTEWGQVSPGSSELRAHEKALGIRRLKEAEENVLTRWALIHHAIESPAHTDFAQYHVEVGAAVALHLSLLHAHAGCGQDTAHGKHEGQRDGNWLAHGTGICLMLADAEELMPLHLPRHAYILATGMPRQALHPQHLLRTTSVSNCVRGYWDKLSAFSSSCESLLCSFNVSVHFSLTYANSPPLL